MDDEVLISVKGMSKSFQIADVTKKKSFFQRNPTQSYLVFEDIDLEVRKGEVLAILGRNGCGKSTFMKIISGIIEPDTGTVEVKGKVASILELSMGFHGDLTGKENIILRSELYGIPRETVKEYIDDIAKYSDLGVFIDNPVRTYSSGMRSRLAFAIMVNVDADVFLVDEALSTGDMAFASKASEYLKNLVRSGKTVVFTSHSMSTIKNTCNRAIWIDNHHIVMDGPADEVCDAYSRSINESVDETRNLAEGGSSSAQYRLATFYRDGKDVEKDHDKYIFWLEAASERDHPLAMVELADNIFMKDRERAAELYRRSAEAGNNDARRKYAMMMEESQEEIIRMREIMKELAESGYPHDLYNYGDILYRTALGTEDREEAFRLVSEASEKGWLEADVLLSRMYQEGSGVERDIDKAIDLLRRASSKGNTKAMIKLADGLYEGKYFKKDREEAYKWYLMSARTGNPRAQYMVSLMLSDGDGVEKDEGQAKQWLARYSSTMINDMRLNAMEVVHRRFGPDDPRPNDMLKEASKDYHSRSMVTLSKRYKDGKGFKKNLKGYVSLMEKAAIASGHPRTQLAMMYLKGDGVEKDEAKAFELLKDASDSGDSAAMLQLGFMYRDGTFVENDVNMYRFYVRMSADRGNRDASELVRKWDSRKKH